MLGVLVAVGRVDLETGVLPALADAPGVHVVRRCVDIPDLLAVAASRQADAALVSLGLPGLDAAVVDRLVELDVTVVGVCPADADTDRSTLNRLGAHTVLAPDQLTDLSGLVGALRQRTDGALRDPHGGPVRDPVDMGLGPGRVIAVWGAIGSPGRTTVALGIGSGTAGLGLDTLVVDVDVYGGTVAQSLGLLEESSGLLAATRAANLGGLRVDLLARHACQVAPALRVLTGLPRADRWTEVPPVLLRAVLDTARALADVTVLDCGFSLERDEEVVYDTAAPRRNGATVEALARADTVVVVGAADPIGLGRLIRGLDELSETLPGTAPYVVVNRSRGSLGWGDEEIAETVRRTSGIDVRAFLPDDPSAADLALVQGRAVGECAPESKLAIALRTVAAELVGSPVTPHRRLRRRTAARAR